MGEVFKKYRRSGITEMREYIPGESLDGVSVNEVDDLSKGGMIARNTDNHNDKWFVSKEYFDKNGFSVVDDVGEIGYTGRVLDIGTTNFTEVVCCDEPGEGGACYVYKIKSIHGQEFSNVSFQKGPIKEAGVNGCHNEDLIAIVIDRLRGFQSGEYECRENALAITKLEEAMHWLNHRTADRKKRGVEGTREK